MRGFSDVVKKEIDGQMSVSEFAARMGFSDKYVYDLFKRRNGSRWNSNSIDKACDILGLEIIIKKKESAGIYERP